MKYKNISAGLLIASASFVVHAGPFSPAAGQAGSEAISMSDAAITSWATGYQDYQPGANLIATWETPNRALGQAQGTSIDIVSLGEGGRITMTFSDPIANGAGYDFAVFENSFSDTFLELARVEVSSDGSNFYGFSVTSLTPAAIGPFGQIDPTDIDGLAGKYRQGWGTGFDLDLLAGTAGLDIFNVSYVRLIDIIGDGTMFDDSAVPNAIYDPYQTFESAGFDLDAIGVLNSASTVVPVPASIWLFASGLIGLLSLRRKKA
jgi:hypothetical protein